ncbi:MAG: helix-turn-helix domain-containing protein [Acidobacteriota bacterium]
MTEAPPGGFSLADVVRSARERMGLSQRQLAARLDVAPSTVAKVERGEDARASTLEQLMAGLPGLLATDLFPQCVLHAPPSCPSSWALLRDGHGFVAETLRVALRLDDGFRGELAQLQLRPVPEGAPDPPGLLAVLSAACIGRRSIVRGVLAGDDFAPRFELTEDGMVHRFESRENGQGWRASYHCDFGSGVTGHDEISESMRERLGLVGGGTHVTTPAETLELSVALEDDFPIEQARCLAWPEGVLPSTDAPDLMPLLHPTEVRFDIDPENARIGVVIRRPILGLTYAIGCPVEGSDGVTPAVQRAVRSVGLWSGGQPTRGEILARLREQAGLSQRALARQLGISQVTVNAAENGRDVRHSTLMKYLESFPVLAPQLLLSPSSPPIDTDAATTWKHQRDLVGIEVAAATKTLRVGDDGEPTIELATRSLQAFRVLGDELCLRIGLQRGVQRAGSAELIELESDNENLRTRIVHGPDGRAHALLLLNRSIALEGISYTRRYEAGPVFTRIDDPESRPLSGLQGTIFAVNLPTRRLQLIIEPPAWPDDIRHHVFPFSAVPVASMGSTRPQLAAERIRLRRERSRHRIVLDVHRPLIGYQYGVSWRPA